MMDKINKAQYDKFLKGQICDSLPDFVKSSARLAGNIRLFDFGGELFVDYVETSELSDIELDEIKDQVILVR